ncbi:hypothetical protein [Mucilaginibacter terrae]|uniref:Uncharacterized protein n=1 Tax=Mucilaginibacter terrae TaxID=1955052 RepID=A0ABU3GP44_9SPHI|nr:hypothetical protein [Mucilaginibacter terrae]MDT3401291.1 hypothetical protein [Mucilaginibacter terrae]
MQNQKNLFNLPDWVVVDPALADDPRLRAGEIGQLTYAIVNFDEFYVGFEDVKVRVYGAADLLMVKDANALFQYVEDFGPTLNEYETNAILNAALLEIYAADSGYQKEALKIALQYPSLTDAMLISFESKLKLGRGAKTGR